MSSGDDWRETFRPDIPSPARMYNYFLGGKDHFEVDRKAAEQVIATIPDVLVFARENRAFLRRAVRYLVSECGIRQIIARPGPPGPAGPCHGGVCPESA